MKKSLLTLGLLGLAGGAFAQATNPNRIDGPWAEVNQTNVNTPASYAIDQLVTLSPTFAWGIAYDGTSTVTSPPKNSSVRVNNAAGTQFDFTSIAATAGFQPSNITVPRGVTNNTTAFCGQYGTGFTNGGGGEVIRSTNGGASWRKISSAAMFGNPAGFCNWVYAFDVNNVVTGGDPNPLPATGPGQFEFWYSTNAAAANTAANPVVWTRCQNMPTPLDAEEYALVGSYTAVGDTIWAGTSHSPGMVDGPARVLRSTDKGRTWSVFNTPMTGSVPNLAFKDSRNGIAYKPTTSGMELMWTADGGQTWFMDTDMPDPATADTLRGKLYRFGISAIPKLGYMSYGDAIPSSRLLQNRGASFSCTGHGKTWQNVDKMRATYIGADFINVSTPSNPRAYAGYLGGFTDPATLTNPTGGTGGIYQVATTGATAPLCITGTTKQDAELKRGMTVSPNPSANGVFQLHLTDGIKAGTMLTVFDALGRQVLSRELSATAANSKSLNVDLSKEKAGVYTLRLTTAAGIATQKLVIQ